MEHTTLLHSVIPFALSGLVGAAIIFIGIMYIVAPERMVPRFGLKPPAQDADTRAWLRLKGIRDIASGLTVFAVMWATDHRTVGIVMLSLAFIPFGDMANVLLSQGRKATALSVHAPTCALMVAAGLLLLHIL